jgi:ABC-type polysaccharide/polyol phosphate transport system ATPase subunit
MKEPAVHIDRVAFGFRVSKSGAASLREWIQKGGSGVFQRKKVLDKVTLTIPQGSCYGILGRNGSGKSTLLRIISGIIIPDEGRVQVNGKIAPILSLGAGLEPELSGYDNIRLLCVLMGLHPREIRNAIKIIAEFSELSEEELTMQVKRYSTGMMARLSFSIAIALHPDILIIDEVLAVGDVGFQEKCYQRILEIKNSGSTIIFVSHSMADVLQLCDKACVLENGKVIYEGDVKESCDIYTRQFTS